MSLDERDNRVEASLLKAGRVKERKVEACTDIDLTEKIFPRPMKNVVPNRQKFTLLIPKGNFGDSTPARFQPLSASSGRLSKSAARAVLSASPKKDRQP
jgi:hypothetical protein